jgi:hypothetical protein
MRREIRVTELVKRTMSLLKEFAEEIDNLEGKMLILEPGRSRIRQVKA